MVAMTPLITIQVMGFIYSRKIKEQTEIISGEVFLVEDEIIDYEEVAEDEKGTTPNEYKISGDNSK